MRRREFLNIITSAMASGVLTTRLGQMALAAAADEKIDTPIGMDLETQKRMQMKIDHFDENFADDIFVTGERLKLLTNVHARLLKARDVIGFARFNLLTFDELLKYAAHHSKIAPFTAAEKSFIEEIFVFDARQYGFWGEKQIQTLTSPMRESDTIEIAGSHHYLFKGPAVELYQKVLHDVGSDVILTSGVRWVVKQLQLFCAKAVVTQGNLSRASRSLAPPGYSFHGRGDFDVGKVGWGERNFTSEFAQTEIFKRLIDLGYVDIRYTKNNNYGVRFEPWHIKV